MRIYTDGSGTTRGPIGWAFCAVIEDNLVHSESGGMTEGTSNIAEMQAVIHALQWADTQKFDSITIMSDSAYVVNAFNDDWISGWKKRKWKNARGRKVANRELWEILIDLVELTQANFEHVPGHTGIKYNEMADTLCGLARKGM